MVIGDLDITGRLGRFFEELFGWLPLVLGALVVLIVGYFVAKVVGKLVARALERVGLDRWVQRGFGGSAISRVVSKPSALLGTVMFWVLFIASISIAVDILGIAALEDAIRAVWSYVPNVLAALAIFLIAGALAAGVSRLAKRTMGDTGTGRIVATVAPILIMAIAVFMMLDMLEIAENIVVITYASLMGALALGMALAFGLGGRDVAAQMLQGAYAKNQGGMEKLRRDVQQGRERAKEETRRLQQEPATEAPQGPGSYPAA